ncbi:Kinase-like protein [Mycena sanguinolenta]|uniref:Kinase-like protein n=1 Tax=Mycena sanguinolenta TaxID=230812 RepID=A0A8H6XB00_9AGAR|nr:Kinase-like protein [Mycena sanguinolenta]
MDSQSESEAEFIVVSTSDYAEALPSSVVVSPQVQGYSETTGMQTVDRRVNNYNYYISGGVGGTGGDARDNGTGGESLSPFRTIRLGDLNLVTVAMYQGDGVEEEWRQALAKYQSVRHPNILQLYGLVNTEKLCAMVFHEELVPYDQFLRRFEHSSILTTYIMGYCRTEWDKAEEYHNSNFPGADGGPWLHYELQLWIRPATGQLCVDLSLGHEQEHNAPHILVEI